MVSLRLDAPGRARTIHDAPGQTARLHTKGKGSGMDSELIRAVSAARIVRGRRPLDIEDTANEFAQRDAEMAPKPPLQAGVVLRAAEKVAHQLPENRAASQKLHHPRRYCRAQEGAAVKAPHDARCKLELRRKCRPHARRICFRAAFP